MARNGNNWQKWSVMHNGLLGYEKVLAKYLLNHSRISRQNSSNIEFDFVESEFNSFRAVF